MSRALRKICQRYNELSDFLISDNLVNQLFFVKASMGIKRINHCICRGAETAASEVSFLAIES